MASQALGHLALVVLRVMENMESGSSMPTAGRAFGPGYWYAISLQIEWKLRVIDTDTIF